MWSYDALVQLRSDVLPHFHFTPRDPRPLVERVRTILATEPLGREEAALLTPSGPWGGLLLEDPFRERTWHSLDDVPYLTPAPVSREHVLVCGEYLTHASIDPATRHLQGTRYAPGLEDHLVELLAGAGYSHMDEVHHDRLWLPRQRTCRRPLPAGAERCSRCRAAADA